MQRTLFLLICILHVLPSFAQKAKIPLVDEAMIKRHMLASKPSTLTQEQIKKIEKIVAPYRTKIMAILEADKTGTYKAYTDDLQKTQKVTSQEKRNKMQLAIRKKYESYFLKIWEKNKSEESKYQKEIRTVLAENIREKIVFGPFLTFTYKNIIGIKPQTSVTATLPTNTCVDLIQRMSGTVNTDRFGGAGAGEGKKLACDTTGCYGTLHAFAHDYIVGEVGVDVELMSVATIPGDFISDSRLVRMKMTGSLSLSAFAVGIGGLGMCHAYLEGPLAFFQVTAIAPFAWISSDELEENLNNNFLMTKSTYMGVRNILNIKAQAFARGFITGSSSFVSCPTFKWTLCEEQQTRLK